MNVFFTVERNREVVSGLLDADNLDKAILTLLHRMNIKTLTKTIEFGNGKKVTIDPVTTLTVLPMLDMRRFVEIEQFERVTAWN